MSPNLFFDNKKYISAKEASLITGYSSDYVGQLARSKKIDSKKIGHHIWYVGEESILKYKNLSNGLGLTPRKKILSTGGKLLLLTFAFLLIVGTFSLGDSNLSKILKNISASPIASYDSLATAFKNYLSPTSSTNLSDLATSYKNYLPTTSTINLSDLASTYKNYVSSPSISSGPSAPTIKISDLASAYKNYVSSPSNYSGQANSTSTIKISDLATAYKNYLTPPAVVKVIPPIVTPSPKIITARGPAGPTGPSGPQGPTGPQGGAGNSLDPSTFVLRTFFDGQVNRIFDSISNSTRGLADSLNKEVDTKLLSVSGNASVGGDLTISGATTLSGAVSLNGATLVTGSNTFTVDTGLATFGANISLTATSPIIDSTAGTFSINTTNNNPVTFGTGLVTIPNLAVTNSQSSSGAFTIDSNATTQNIFTITGVSLTSGSGITENLTANAGNSQTTFAHSINLVDATTGGGGYTALSIATTGGPGGSGPKYLLDLNPGANKNVVFDSTGSFRPTATTSANTNTLGSPGFYWKTIYADQVTANSIAGVVVGGATSSTTWTIGSTQVGDANEALIFQKNSGSGNATLQWNQSAGGAGDLRYLSVNNPLNATYTVDGSSISPDVNLLSANLTNNTSSGIQKLLSLSNTGSGTTENGIYINNTGTAATTALEIAGTWTNGIITGNNSINAGTGAISGGAITSSGALAMGANTITSGLINGQTISSAANFTGSVVIAGAVTGATSYNGLIITANTGTITTGVWNGTAIANANLANSSLTIGTTNIALGATSLTLAGLTAVGATTFTGALTGNASTATNVAVGGITGLGTGVATALAVNVGTAGSPLVNGGVLGTPSSGTGTNITGIPAANILAGTFGTGNYSFGTGTLAVGAITSSGALALGANTITSGLINGQTISSAANFTGTLTVAGVTTLSNLTASSAIYTDASKNLTSAVPTSGQLGYWTRSGTNLYNTNQGDNVGIGNTAPLSKLGVTGGASFGATYGIIAAPVSGMIIEGNVGIGTTGPGYPLTVTSSATDRVVSVINTRTTGTSYGVVSGATGAATTNVGGYFYTSGATNNYGVQVGIDLVAGANNYAIYANSPAQNYFAGNVGIGETVPGTKLSVLGGMAVGSTTAYSQAAVTSGNLIVQGNVGIGTTSPANKLDIASSDTSTTLATNFDQIQLIMRNTSNTLNNWRNFLFYADNTLGIAGISAQLTNNTGANRYGDLVLGTRGGDGYNERLRITNTGNVGIGTTNPGYALEVNASTNNIAYFHDGVTNTGCTLSGGGIIACSSDVRLKKNVLDINYGLDTVMALRPVVYNWNYEADGSVKSLGFIAQEVEALVPKLIATDGSGMKSLNTIGFVPILTKAIQEMNLNLEGVAGTITPLPGSPSETFATAFFNNLKTVIGTWLADAGNGISNIFATTITVHNANVDNLCVSDANGKTCITRAQLDALLAGPVPSLSAPAAPVPSVSSGPAPDPATPAAGSNISALTTAKATVEGLITAHAVESTTPGDHVVGALATLTAANTAANATTADTQSVVDGQVATLNTAIATYNEAIVPAP
jgi:hypothetical protein